jgi:hypothetical protein
VQRRKFLKNGSLAALAASLPASSLLAKQDGCSLSEYSGTKQIEGADFTYQFTIDICNYIIEGLADAPPSDKNMTLSIMKNKSDGSSAIEYQATYEVKSSVARKNEQYAYDMEAVLKQELTTDLVPPAEVDFKKLKFYYNSKDDLHYFVLRDKKGNDYVTLPLTILTAPDCFLTTACVTTLGKPDNCPELTTLRTFRDNILVNMHEGKEMITEYYTIAPPIVKNINAQPEHKEIYLGIYNDMIIPVMENIERNNYIGAVDIYRNYTLALKTKYGN